MKTIEEYAAAHGNAEVLPWQRSLFEFISKLEPGDRVKLVHGRRRSFLTVEKATR